MPTRLGFVAQNSFCYSDFQSGNPPNSLYSFTPERRGEPSGPNPQSQLVFRQDFICLFQDLPQRILHLKISARKLICLPAH